MRISRADIASSIAAVLVLAGCDNYFKNDYRDNSPTSGQLKVYFDEGILPHVDNQVFTFQSQYPNAHIKMRPTSEEQAVRGLLQDSCEAIVITRSLSEAEKSGFAARKYDPDPTLVAYTGLALVTSRETGPDSLSVEEIRTLLLKADPEKKFTVVFDRNNSAVMRYVMDSVLSSNPPGSHCRASESTTAAIEYAINIAGSIAFVDFAWLSDMDDSYYRSIAHKVKFVGVKRDAANAAVFPAQGSFKTGHYVFTRPVYVLRKTGEFSLAKGFQTFVAGPKGQLTFLKQGLLPARQPERQVEVKFEQMNLQ